MEPSTLPTPASSAPDSPEQAAPEQPAQSADRNEADSSATDPVAATAEESAPPPQEEAPAAQPATDTAEEGATSQQEAAPAQPATDTAAESATPPQEEAPATKEAGGVTRPDDIPASNDRLIAETESVDGSAAESQTPAESSGGSYGTLAEWWAAYAAPEKEFADLQDDGTILLRAMGDMPARPIGRISGTSGDNVFKALTDKFKDASGQLDALSAEWDTTEDKTKLHGKISRQRDYLAAANALGDYKPLLEKLQGWEFVVKGHFEEEERTATTIVEKAEALVESEDWKEATNTLKELSDQWRALPQAERHRYDALFKRLNTAKDAFFERKRKHSEEIEKEHLVNYDRKLELVEKAEALAGSERWKATTEALKLITDEWKTVGRTAADKTAQLWNRFSAAKDAFFERKRQHFEFIEKEQEGNYPLKLALVEKAEGMAESTDWNRTTNEYAALLDEWKRIGKVPLEKADELWNRLNKAKDTFFNNKRQHLDVQRVELEDNLARKQSLIKRAESLKDSTQWRETTDELNELMDEWKQIGAAPREHHQAVWEQFLGARKHFFNRKDADRDRRMDRYQAQSRLRQDDARKALDRLRAEVKEEEEKITDFREALGNITPGPKATELREHLEKLIPETERNLTRLRQTLERAERDAAGGGNRDGGQQRSNQPRPERERGGRQQGGREQNRRGEPRADARPEAAADVAQTVAAQQETPSEANSKTTEQPEATAPQTADNTAGQSSADEAQSNAQPQAGNEAQSPDEATADAAPATQPAQQEASEAPVADASNNDSAPATLGNAGEEAPGPDESTSADTPVAQPAQDTEADAPVEDMPITEGAPASDERDAEQANDAAWV